VAEDQVVGPSEDPDQDAVDPAAWSCPTPVGHRTEVVMGHGGGGRLTAELVAEVFLPVLGNDTLSALADAAVVEVGGCRLAMSTDAFVVRPLFFPGGDIGHLAVHGTVNDLACAGAIPLHLTASFVIDEGTSFDTLRRVASSMAQAARDAGVCIVAGDTKVVEARAPAGSPAETRDGVIITTAGVGLVRPESQVAPDQARPGDAVIVSGPIGQHGVAVMSVRDGLEFGSPVISDTAPVHGLVAALFDAGLQPHALRDPTRGGVAAALNEIAVASGVGIVLDEASVPVPSGVRSACALLGLDPLQVANEGRVLVLLPSSQADLAVDALRQQPGGGDAAIIGSVVDDHLGMVVARTALGSTRVIDLPLGELLPRIC
jgi:hydrogenase expression/formation protein HypE